MHEYLMEVGHYFLGSVRFQVVANDRAEAMEKGAEYVKNLHNDNYIKDHIKVVKKLKPSFGDDVK